MNADDRRSTAVLAVPPLPPVDPSERPRGSAVLTLGVLVAVVALGFAMGRVAGPAVQTKMWPWVVGRGIGIAGYVALSALTAAGLWTRHPLRQRAGVGNPATWLHVHAALAADNLTLKDWFRSQANAYLAERTPPSLPGLAAAVPTEQKSPAKL